MALKFAGSIRTPSCCRNSQKCLSRIAKATLGRFEFQSESWCYGCTARPPVWFVIAKEEKAQVKKDRKAGGGDFTIIIIIIVVIF